MKINILFFFYLFCVSVTVAQNDKASDEAALNSIFNTEEILDESTLDIKVLQDWHIDSKTGMTRQKLIEINVAEWWPGQDYRIPVRLVVPLNTKAKGFHITGANSYDFLMNDLKLNAFDSKLLANGVGIVKTVVKPLSQIPGKEQLEKKMMQMLAKDLNPRYVTVWIWPMTLMRATTAAFAETDHFEKGKVAGSGGSKNGISPATALINDSRFTATFSSVALAYASPSRKSDREELANLEDVNNAFFKAASAGEFKLNPQRAKWYKANMVGGKKRLNPAALSAGKSFDDIHNFANKILNSLCVTEHWDQLRERNVDMFFEPGTHDYVAYDILWGAQNHPELPLFYQPNGGHKMQPHHAAPKNKQNLQAFLWNHFFDGDPLMKPPKSTFEVVNDKLQVTVRFDEGPQPKNGRIWWIYDRAPAGSAPFLHVRIPDDQWMDMEYDVKTKTWIANIPLEDGYSQIDFFSSHGSKINGYQQYISSPYSRLELQ